MRKDSPLPGRQPRSWLWKACVGVGSARKSPQSGLFVFQRFLPVLTGHEAHTVDGTSGIVVTRVSILNREVIAAPTVTADTKSAEARLHLDKPRIRGLAKWVGPARSDTLSNR